MEQQQETPVLRVVIRQNGNGIGKGTFLFSAPLTDIANALAGPIDEFSPEIDMWRPWNEADAHFIPTQSLIKMARAFTPANVFDDWSGRVHFYPLLGIKKANEMALLQWFYYDYNVADYDSSPDKGTMFFRIVHLDQNQGLRLEPVPTEKFILCRDKSLFLKESPNFGLLYPPTSPIWPLPLIELNGARIREGLVNWIVESNHDYPLNWLRFNPETRATVTVLMAMLQDGVTFEELLVPSQINPITRLGRNKNLEVRRNTRLVVSLFRDYIARIQA